VILGGGTGSLAAALGLTSRPNWQDQYEITVYQLGWRLGGKGASGRNPDQHHRIEEHGLHIWAGFYYNGFQAMRTCYEELQRPPGSPLATVWDAFKPKSDCTVTENIDNQWLPWGITMPTNNDLPGDDFDTPTIGEHIRRLMTWILDHLENGGLFQSLSHSTETHTQPSVSDSLWNRVLSVESMLRGKNDPTVLPNHRDLSTFDRALNVIGDATQWLLLAIKRVVTTLLDDLGEGTAEAYHALADLLGLLRSHLHAWFDANPSPDTSLRREFLIVDFGFATTIGLILDDVILNGYSSIDDIEWKDWLRKHGATESTVNSVITRSTYDYVFGYLNGDVNTPSIGAGTCTHGLLLLTLCYQGALFWEMQAGMGDTVFSPLYLVLKKRGVRFQFFHRADAIRLDATDPTKIGAIDFGVQMETVSGQEYDPLIPVKNLPCWPSQPQFDQLIRGDELKRSGQNLESPWADWTDASKITLKRGQDFDLVILGISVAALKALTPELMSANPKWADMVNQIQTTQTQAMQIWLKSTSAQLGWDTQPLPVVTAYADDMNTWGDLSHLLAREDWPTESAPLNESYFCGPLKDSVPIPPFSDHGYPNRMNDQVKQSSIEWLESNVEFLMPLLAKKGQVDWNQLVADDRSVGIDRFNTQYWRANIAPTERYVISAAGTTKYRLPADGSGFSNLYLAGDWVLTEINAGCVEAAMMAGLSASQAICGFPEKILGMSKKSSKG
jgi:uncharacterized protein with NAD-binding domain and iron-sulfur cluster